MRNDGAVLRQILKERDLYIQDVADALGITRQAINNYFNTKKFSYKTMQKIIRYLYISETQCVNYNEPDVNNIEQIETTTFIESSKRITKKYMTIYERVRVLGERAKQLSLGAKPLIKGVENMDPKVVARMELEKKVIPLIIIRTLPNGQKEKWRVSELEIIN